MKRRKESKLCCSSEILLSLPARGSQTTFAEDAISLPSYLAVLCIADVYGRTTFLFRQELECRPSSRTTRILLSVSTPVSYYCNQANLQDCIGQFIYIPDEHREFAALEHAEAICLLTLRLTGGRRRILSLEGSGRDRNTSARLHSPWNAPVGPGRQRSVRKDQEIKILDRQVHATKVSPLYS